MRNDVGESLTALAGDQRARVEEAHPGQVPTREEFRGDHATPSTPVVHPLNGLLDSTARETRDPYPFAWDPRTSHPDRCFALWLHGVESAPHVFGSMEQVREG